jgi:hypothetical protein
MSATAISVQRQASELEQLRETWSSVVDDSGCCIGKQASKQSSRTAIPSRAQSSVEGGRPAATTTTPPQNTHQDTRARQEQLAYLYDTTRKITTARRALPSLGSQPCQHIGGRGRPKTGVLLLFTETDRQHPQSPQCLASLRLPRCLASRLSQHATRPPRKTYKYTHAVEPTDPVSNNRPVRPNRDETTSGSPPPRPGILRSDTHQVTSI